MVSNTEDTISVDTLDKCPVCELEWKYTVVCSECQGKGCEHTDKEHKTWCSYYPEGEHSPHTCQGGRRGPFSYLIGVEYAYGTPERYDGVSEWMCPRCETRWGRWTGRVLREGELERRFGGKK